MATTAEQRSRQLDPGPLITLYQLDLTPKGGPVYYFHDGIAQGTNQIIFGGHTYTAFPIRAEGFEWSTRGALPRPTLSVSNIASVVSQLLRSYDDFVGCVLTQLKTFAAFITGGSEPSNAQYFPYERFVVERKTAENNTICSFELSMPIDAEGKQLPGRMIMAHTCIWIYRGPDCGYNGAAKQNRNGSSIAAYWGRYRGLYSAANLGTGNDYLANDYVYTLATQPNGTQVRIYWVKTVDTSYPLKDGVGWWMDVCLKKQSDCELHFGAGGQLPTSAFPACYKIK
jgi:lambda family phage minor tail protein L